MNHRRGFTLTELLLAVSLFGVFALLAYRLIGANFHVTTATLVADSNSARFDQAVGALRSDVMNSTSLEMPTPMLLRLHDAQSQVIEWQLDKNAISRTASKTVRSWEVGRPLKLNLDGTVVLLSASPNDQIAMAPSPQRGTK